MSEPWSVRGGASLPRPRRDGSSSRAPSRFVALPSCERKKTRVAQQISVPAPSRLGMPDYLPKPSSFATVSAPPEFAPFCCAPSGSSVPPTDRGCPKLSATRRRPPPSTLPSYFQTEISKNRPYDRPPLSTTGRRSARRPVILAIPRSASGEPTSGHCAAIPPRLPNLFISSESSHPNKSSHREPLLASARRVVPRTRRPP